VGVPPDWLADVRAASDDSFLEIAGHLPAEAAEALLEYAATGMLHPAEVTPPEATFAHPDTLRRFRVVENLEELERALDAPWERWTIFLHPSQRATVERSFSGPARVAGSAGTGKTVVALHRAAGLARSNPSARLLLTTFSRPLASALERKLKILVGEQSSVVPRITVAPFAGIAEELYQIAFGRRPHIASVEDGRSALAGAAEGLGVTEFSERFLISEWTHVVDAWQLASAEEYAEVPRLGRKSRMGVRQRERLWPVFEEARKALNERGLLTRAEMFAAVTEHYAERPDKPFTHIVVDEAQDLGVPELRFLAAIAPAGPDALFFAGDLGQRIFQQPFSWKGLGIDVRGRSQTLKVNYRTSHQIRQAADRLLPKAIRDVDGLEEERSGTVSVFNGPAPIVSLHDDGDQEIAAVAQFIAEAVTDGIAPSEIGVFVRTRRELDRARAAIAKSGHEALEISERSAGAPGRISIGTMHLAKGLEFKAVAVMACDDEVLPLQSRIETVTDEVELDDVYETERQLFYVACTRARDRLMISGIRPGSEFLADLEANS
jgi:superfamily I DNA/RNA helicase